MKHWTTTCETLGNSKLDSVASLLRIVPIYFPVGVWRELGRNEHEWKEKNCCAFKSYLVSWLISVSFHWFPCNCTKVIKLPFLLPFVTHNLTNTAVLKIHYSWYFRPHILSAFCKIVLSLIFVPLIQLLYIHITH